MISSMSRLINDLSGLKTGFIEVIRFSAIKNREAHFECVCSCGQRFVRRASHIKNGGENQSCGCKVADISRKQMTKHGLSRTREYQAWRNAKNRCYRASDVRFYCYGAKGIGMCEQWRESFEVFFADMGTCPDGLTLERLDRTKDYTPENCVWADQRAQQNNRSTNVTYNFMGAKMTLAQIAEHCGVKYKSLHHYVVGRKVPLDTAITVATKVGVKRSKGGERYYGIPATLRRLG